jgi:hypothetical protein
MPTIITEDTVLERVEHIEGSGRGTLDFAVADEAQTYKWFGIEDAEWQIEGVSHVENVEEDRFLLYPRGDFFTCDIAADSEEYNPGPVHCWSE